MASQEKRIQKIAISEFKAKCLAMLVRVNKTKAPLRVTRRGKPIADVVPPSTDGEKHDWIGSMAGRMEITGDIIGHVISAVAQRRKFRAVERVHDSQR